MCIRNRQWSGSSAKHSPSSLPDAVLCAVGFRGTDKQQLAALAAQIGASYSKGLVSGVTTHLVCARLLDASCTSHKYRCALAWGGVEVVSVGWLVASAAARRPLPEEDFKDDDWSGRWQLPALPLLCTKQPMLSLIHILRGPRIKRCKTPCVRVR